MEPRNHCCLHPHRFEQRVRIEKGDWKIENWPERKKIRAPFRIYSDEELKIYYSRCFAVFLGLLITGSIIFLKIAVLQIREYDWVRSTHYKWYSAFMSGILLSSGIAAFISGFSPVRRTVAAVIVLNSLAVAGSVWEIIYSMNTRAYKEEFAFSYMSSPNRKLLGVPRPTSEILFSDEEQRILKYWPNMKWIMYYTLSNSLPVILLFANISVLFTGITSSIYVFPDEELPREDDDLIFVIPQEVDVDFENDESLIAPEIPADDEDPTEENNKLEEKEDESKISETRVQILESSESVDIITPDSEIRSEFAEESLPYNVVDEIKKPDFEEKTEEEPSTNKKPTENGKAIQVDRKVEQTKKLQFLPPVGLSELESATDNTEKKKRRKPITRRKTVTLQVLGMGCIFSAIYIPIYYSVVSEVNYFMSQREPSISRYILIVLGFYFCGLLALGHIRLPRKKWMLAVGGITLFFSSVFLLLTSSKFYSRNRMMKRQLTDNCINNDNQFCIYECFRPKKRLKIENAPRRKCLVFCTPKDRLCDGALDIFEMTSYPSYLGNFGCTFSRYAGEFEGWNKRKFDYYWPSADEMHCHDRWIWWHIGAYFISFYGLLSSIILFAWSKRTIDSCIESYKHEVFGVCSSSAAAQTAITAK